MTSHSPQTVLAFDPSLRNWGWSLCVVSDTIDVVACGVIRHKEVHSNKAQADYLTARAIHNDLVDLIQVYKPDVLVAEFPVGSQSASAMISYALCIGLLGSLGKVTQVTPSQVKTTVGNSTASKADVIAWVNERHPNALPTKHGKILVGVSEHIADSIVVAHTAKIRGLL
jgi:Holliday junction resolvasome RuvABC endonuclease subunit